MDGTGCSCAFVEPVCAIELRIAPQHESLRTRRAGMCLGGREQSWRQISPTIRAQHVEPQFPRRLRNAARRRSSRRSAIGFRRPQRAALARVVRRERPQFRQLPVNVDDDAGVFAPAGSRSPHCTRRRRSYARDGSSGSDLLGSSNRGRRRGGSCSTCAYRALSLPSRARGCCIRFRGPMTKPKLPLAGCIEA